MLPRYQEHTKIIIRYIYILLNTKNIIYNQISSSINCLSDFKYKLIHDLYPSLYTKSMIN